MACAFFRNSVLNLQTMKDMLQCCGLLPFYLINKERNDMGTF